MRSFGPGMGALPGQEFLELVLRPVAVRARD